MKLLKLIIFTASLFFSLSAKAQIPTTDLVNFMQNFNMYLEQIEEGINTLEQLEAAQEQLENAENMRQALEGFRDLADLMNSDEFQEFRRDVPDNPVAVIADLSSGELNDDLNDNYLDVLEDLMETYSVLDPNDNSPVNEEDIPDRYNAVKARTKAVKTNKITTAYVAANNSANNIQTAEALIAQIDETEDLKASLDLNSRILGELLIQLNQQIKLDSTIHAAQAESEVADEELKKLNKARYRAGYN